jgi:hypothetical protein
MARLFVQTPRVPVRFWLEAGQFENSSPIPGESIVVANRHLRDVLEARGYEVSHRERVGGHDWVWWRVDLVTAIVDTFATPPKAGPAVPPLVGKPTGIAVVATGRPLIPYLLRIGLIDGGPAAVVALERLVTSNPDKYELTEQAVDDAGYPLVSHGHLRDAIALWEWNVRHHPSSTTYESLGVGYQLAHQPAKARAAYLKAIELDPNNVVPAVNLERLEH